MFSDPVVYKNRPKYRYQSYCSKSFARFALKLQFKTKETNMFWLKVRGGLGGGGGCTFLHTCPLITFGGCQLALWCKCSFFWLTMQSTFKEQSTAEAWLRWPFCAVVKAKMLKDATESSIGWIFKYDSAGRRRTVSARVWAVALWKGQSDFYSHQREGARKSLLSQQELIVH